MSFGRSIIEHPVGRWATDVATGAVVAAASPALKLLARRRRSLPGSLALADRLNLSIRSHHYYDPSFDPATLKSPLTAERELPGLILDPDSQRALLDRMQWQDELREAPIKPPSSTEFGHANGAFGYGDAEMLYNFIRFLKPKRLIEVGSGNSTLMAAKAIDANRAEDPHYRCEHICIEPYEMPWLESTGVKVIRQKVEDCDLALFQSLEADDILFVDSSHVIRPQGDVLFEVNRIYPVLGSGVVVHVHDIFTPRDYPEQWVVKERRLWNEQYLLEAFLTFNDRFEVLCALNWLWRNQPEAVARACPRQGEKPPYDPSSFWFRRK